MRPTWSAGISLVEARTGRVAADLNMQLAIFILCVLVASVANAEVPKPCDTPPQWEGTATFQDQENGVLKVLKLSYDATNNRTRALSILVNGQEPRCEVMVMYACTHVMCTCIAADDVPQDV